MLTEKEPRARQAAVLGLRPTPEAQSFSACLVTGWSVPSVQAEQEDGVASFHKQWLLPGPGCSQGQSRLLCLSYQ